MDEETYRDRYARGFGFMLATTGNRALRDEAASAFDALEREIRRQGGWLIEDGVRGSTPSGYSELMQERSEGVAPWEVACPKIDARPRGRDRMKIPMNMAVFQGFPCWALDGRTYSLDLFNPANELALSTPNSYRYWQITPWPWHFAGPDLADSEFSRFAALIGSVALAIEPAFGCGTDAELAYFAIASRRAPPGSFESIERLAFGYYLLTREVAREAINRVGEAQPTDTGHEGHCRILSEIGASPGYVLIGAPAPRSAFPGATESGIRALAAALGRKHLNDMGADARTPEQS